MKHLKTVTGTPPAAHAYCESPPRTDAEARANRARYRSGELKQDRSVRVQALSRCLLRANVAAAHGRDRGGRCPDRVNQRENGESMNDPPPARLAERVENPDARVEKSSAAADIDRNVRRTR